MKPYCLTLLTVAVSAMVSPVRGDALKTAFQTPPDMTKLGVYWYFLDGNQNREAMVADLHAMHDVGIGSVTFLEVDLGIPRGPIPFMTEQWQDNVAHSFVEAGKLGMEVISGHRAGLVRQWWLVGPHRGFHAASGRLQRESDRTGHPQPGAAGSATTFAESVRRDVRCTRHLTPQNFTRHPPRCDPPDWSDRFRSYTVDPWFYNRAYYDHQDQFTESWCMATNRSTASGPAMRR